MRKENLFIDVNHLSFEEKGSAIIVPISKNIALPSSIAGNRA